MKQETEDLFLLALAASVFPCTVSWHTSGKKADGHDDINSKITQPTR